MNESQPVIRIEIEDFASKLDHLELVALAVIMTTICIVTVAGNLLVLLSFLVDRKLRTRNNYFILSLAVSDTMIGTFSMPLFTLYALNGQWVYGPVLCDMWLAQDYTCSCASSLHLVIIALDRYFSVVSPLRYRARKDSRLVGAMIGCVWVLSFLMWPPWIYAWQYIEGERTVPGDDCYVQFLETNVVATFVTSAVTYYVPVSIICVLYFRIWRETVKRKEFLASMESRHDCGEKNDRTSVTRMSSSTRSDTKPDNSSPGNLVSFWPKSLPDSGVGSSRPPCPVAEMMLIPRRDVETNKSSPGSQPRVTSSPITLPGSRDNSTVAVSEMPVPMSSLCTCSDMKPNNSLPGNQPWVTFPKSLPGSGDNSSQLPDTVAEMVIQMSSVTSSSDMKPNESLSGNKPWVTSSPKSFPDSEDNSSQPSDTVAEMVIPMSSLTSCSDMKPHDPLPGSQPRITSSPKSSLGSGVNSNQPPDTVTETVSENLASPPTKNKPKATPCAGRQISAAGSTRNSNAKSSDNKAAKMLAAILCAFFVTATPYNVVIAIMSLDPSVYVPDAVWFFVYYLFYINSALDPICYALANEQFRKTYWKVLTFRWGQQRRSAKGSKPKKGGSSSRITRV